MAAPDTGGTKRANAYAKHLGCDMAICYKQRKVANQIDSMTVIGDIKERTWCSWMTWWIPQAH
jgi:ribose-phosphate pyrophosphokinase